LIRKSPPMIRTINPANNMRMLMIIAQMQKQS
jgi:hypothetical protein